MLTEGIRPPMHRGTALRAGLGLVATIVLGGVMVSTSAPTSAGLGGTSLPYGYTPGPSLYPWATGVPAIKPHAVISSGGAGASDAVPTFTKADIVAWVSSTPFGAAVVGDPPPIVTSVAFLTDAQVASKLHGEDPGIPPSSLVAYVRVSGTFAQYSPLGGSPLIYHSGYLVFDAHTGNLLMDNVG